MDLVLSIIYHIPVIYEYKRDLMLLWALSKYGLPSQAIEHDFSHFTDENTGE